MHLGSAMIRMPAETIASLGLPPLLDFTALSEIIRCNPSVSPPPGPLSALSTVALVTASDMIPFVPCQPLAVALGSQLGIWAFPICVVGQTLAGTIAFTTARRVTDDISSTTNERANEILNSLGDDARGKFETFRRLGTDAKEGTVLLALIGLRLAPFFPFSAGNYLLGSATGVALRPFLIATVFGCFLSNFLSVAIGITGGEVFQA